MSSTSAESWYAKKGARNQGLVIDETTGRTVAVVYDVKDTRRIAAIPALCRTLKELVENPLLPSVWRELEQHLRAMDRHDIKSPASLFHGYGRLFSPNIPSRIADPMLDNIRRGVEDHDISRLECAIETLSAEHQKKTYLPHVSYKEGEYHGIVTCVPTEFAKELIAELHEIIQEIIQRSKEI